MCNIFSYHISTSVILKCLSLFLQIFFLKHTINKVIRGKGDKIWLIITDHIIHDHRILGEYG